MRRTTALVLAILLCPIMAHGQAIVSPGGGSSLPSPGTAGNVLTSVAGVWASATPSGAGLGDASTNTSSSVAGVMVSFADTSGKVLKSAITAFSGGAGSTITLGASGALTIGASSGLVAAAGKVGTFSNTLTFTGTDSSSVAFGAGGTVAYTGADINTSGQVTALHLAAPLPATSGGTGLAAGTSGGIPYFSGTTTIASSGALTANRLVVGGGAGTTPGVVGSLGTTTTLLHGNASGAPTFGAVSLTADISGVLPVADGGTNNAFFTVVGPATSPKNYTFPNSSSTVLTDAAAVTVAQGGSGATTLTSKGILFGNGTSAIGATAVGTSGQVLTSNGSGQNPTFQTLAAGGTVTSIDTTVPSFLTATDCAITASGTCALSLTSQTANLAFLSPNGTTGVPTFRAMVPQDFPSSISETALTTGSTIGVYGVSYEVDCATACTQVLPTVTAHNGDTLAFCIDDTSAPVTLDANGAQTINGAAARIMVAGECANLVIRSAEWKKISGRSITMTATASRAGGNPAALAAQTLTPITMDTLDSGQSVMWDSVNGQLKAIRPGLYKSVVGAGAGTGGVEGDYFAIYDAVNGGSITASTAGLIGALGFAFLTYSSADQLLAVDDVVKAGAYSYAGGPVIIGTGNERARITLTEVAPW